MKAFNATQAPASPVLDSFYKAVESSLQTAVLPAVQASRLLNAHDHQLAWESVTNAVTTEQAKLDPAIAQQVRENERLRDAVNGFSPSKTLSELLRGIRSL